MASRVKVPTPHRIRLVARQSYEDETYRETNRRTDRQDRTKGCVWSTLDPMMCVHTHVQYKVKGKAEAYVRSNLGSQVHHPRVVTAMKT